MHKICINCFVKRQGLGRWHWRSNCMMVMIMMTCT